MSQHKFLTRFGAGQYYMEHWPICRELTPIFPENRIIRATRFGYKFMPLIAVFTVFIQVIFHNYENIPIAIITALFALSLPLQGLWWLGSRSQTKLPPSLIHWYQEIHQKICEKGIALEPAAKDPTYLALAKLLTKACKELDEHALRRWF